LIAANEVKRNCVRVTEREEKVRNINCEPINKNRIEGVAEQDERAVDREATPISRAARCEPACRVVRQGAQSIMAVPYADYNVIYCHIISSNLGAIPRQNS